MLFTYKGEVYAGLDLFGVLIREFGTCPECGNDRVGGTPSSGALIFDGEEGSFERRCKCGWETSFTCPVYEPREKA